MAGRDHILARLDRCRRAGLREPLPGADDTPQDIELTAELGQRLLPGQNPLDRGPLELC
jgi:hypothetical protein